MDNWDHKSKYFQWDCMKHKMFRFRARITLVLLGSSRQGWVRSVGMSLLLSWLHLRGRCGRGRFVVFYSPSVCGMHIHAYYQSRIHKWYLPAPDVSVEWEALLCPGRKLQTVPAHGTNFWQHPSIQWCTGDLAGFSGSSLPKSSSKHPHSHTGNPGKSRDVLGRCCQPLTLLSLTDTENQLTWDDCFLPDILISAFITEQDT